MIYRRGLLILAVVVALVMVYQPSPLTFTSPVYLPVIFNEYYIKPDRYFGVAEHTPAEAVLLGLAGVNYISGQWRLPFSGGTAVFLRPAERSHWSTWLLCSWSPRDGWYDEEGCRRWVREHVGTIYIIGNELAVGGCIGDGDWVGTVQYARWYHEARDLIKTEDSTADVGPYGPVGQVSAGLLVDVWDSYQEQFGSLLEVDFYPVHHYCQIEDSPQWCWTKLTHWISWLEQYRGTRWNGPRDYWLTEWGLPAWLYPIPVEVSLALMEGMSPYLRDNTIGISHHAWWPSCNSGWPDACTLLVEQGQVTELGVRYLELANE